MEEGEQEKGIKEKIKQGYNHSKKAGPYFKKAASFVSKNIVVLTLLLVLALQFVPNDGGKYPWGGIWLRMESADLPIAEKAANSNIENHIRAEASRIAAEQYPNLPDKNREKVVKDVMKKVRTDYESEFKSQKASIAKEIRDHYSYDANGNSFVYMPDIDTYFYLRHARNIIEKGHVYDIIKDGEPWNDHTKAPIGTAAEKSWHSHVLALIHRVHSAFADTTLMQSATYFPIIFIFMSVFLGFLICWRLSGSFGGFFGATMIALAPSIFGRTTWGHADTDAYNVFFPLLCVWLMIESLFSKSRARQLTFAILSGLSIAVYARLWTGWWYLFDFILGALVVGFVWAVVSNLDKGFKGAFKESSVKKYFYVGIFLFGSALFFSSLTVGFESFMTKTFTSAIDFTSIKDASHPSLWPNVFTTVAELNPASFLGSPNVQGIVPSIGGIMMFCIGLLGVLLLLLKRDKPGPKQLLYALLMLIWILVSMVSYSKGKTWVLIFIPLLAIVAIISVIWKSERSTFTKVFYPLILIIGLSAILYASYNGIEFLIVLGPPFVIAAGLLILLYKHEELAELDFVYAALLALWFVGTIYASFKGVRFILLLGPAFAIAFGVCAGKIYEIISANAKKYLFIQKWITAVVLVLLFVVVIGQSKIVQRNYDSLQGDVPLVNDAWWNVLSEIRENSEPDAIVNSWWDFGHHFKYIADRAVTFDGGTQNSPQAHWIGRVLQTDNEEEAVAILRMLDCGANSAYDVALESTADPLKAVKLVKHIIMQDKSAALNTVRAEGVSEEILKFTHCEPPENYFIASGDMVGKAQVWSHFGLWDFERAEIWLKWRHEPEDVAVSSMVERFNWTEEKAQNVYNHVSGLSGENDANQWISPWLSYLASPQQCSVDNEMLNCKNVKINRTSNKVEISVQGGTAIPGEIISYNREGSFTSLNITDGNKDISVVLWPDGNKIMSLISVKELANSIFTRMYYMNGLGLEYFEPFASDSQLIGGKIFSYKVDWNGTDPYIPENLKPKDSVVNGARVRADYIGFTDEGIFDSSIVDWQNKNISQYANFDSFDTNPLAFIQGSGQLIPGFEQGIENMTPGEEKTIVIPPEEAYGTDPEAHPLGNKTLTFRVKIVSIE